MTDKYTVDLRQFNNGEAEKISFPTFEQSVMYGMHKLKKSFESGNAVAPAIVIEDSYQRKIIVAPSKDEITALHSLHYGRSVVIGPILKLSSTDDGNTLLSF